MESNGGPLVDASPCFVVPFPYTALLYECCICGGTMINASEGPATALLPVSRS